MLPLVPGLVVFRVSGKTWLYCALSDAEDVNLVAAYDHM